MSRRHIVVLAWFIFAFASASRPAEAQHLRLIQFSADSTGLNVGPTLILGPTEAVLVDAGYLMSDARRFADSVAALHTHLKAIFITHPDEDHFFGTEAFLQRFPGTPVYMTPRGVWEFRRVGNYFLEGQKRSRPTEAPDSLITPRLLPKEPLTVDGERLEIIPDLQGDVLLASNSAVWIPSLEAVLAGDIVFNGVHPWLAASDTASRRAWHASIARLKALHPRIVVAAHKTRVDAPDSPDILDAMDRYLTDFDESLRTSAYPDSMVADMKRRYPDYTLGELIQASARLAFRVWR